MNWSAQKAATFDLFECGVPKLGPKWLDPLELKEMIAPLVQGGQISPPEPAGRAGITARNQVLWELMLRSSDFSRGIVINSAPVMDRLENRQCLCDLLRSRPKLLPSMLSLERRTNSKAIQNKLLRSLGESVARLEPPSRRCCTTH